MKNDLKFLNILKENEHFIAVNKPSGLITINDRWDRAKETLVDRVAVYLGAKAWAVHRLDKDASGVILLAKDATARTHFEKQFQGREVKKCYHVFVEGEVGEDSGQIDLGISEDPERPGKMKIGGRNAKSSHTHFEVLERFDGVTLLKVTPKTGRQHQIRVHFQALGHPVLCDPLYGSEKPYYLSEMKRFYKFKEDKPEKPLMGRLALHAGQISFLDMKENWETIDAPLPKDFVVFLKYLRKFWGRQKLDSDVRQNDVVD